MVSQRLVAANFNSLIIPAMIAFKVRSDVLVVVVLGKKGLLSPLSQNTRVPDLIPLDDLLPHCTVLVTNGGYGAFQHTISNRTPLAIAGAGEEKPEVAARAKWVDIGINLRTGSSKPEQVRTAVEEIVNNGKHRASSPELEEER